MPLGAHVSKVYHINPDKSRSAVPVVNLVTVVSLVTVVVVGTVETVLTVK